VRIGLNEPRPADGARPSVLVIGNFDGVHRGHCAVLKQARGEAKTRGLVLSVLTFDPHPAVVLGREPPPLLTALDRKCELLRGLGADIVWVCTFNLELAAWSPEQFARELVKERLLAEVVVVGENFRFGARRAGDLALLRALGASLGFDAQAHGIATDENGPYSSTRARAAIQVGDLAEAEAVLGRRHSFMGIVREGDKRGRTIGFPTANVEETTELLPVNGVYAVVVDEVDDASRALGKGVMNVGVRPTVEGKGRRSAEVHLLDFKGDLYGRALRVHLARRLRDEKKFDGLPELRAQIEKDAAKARSALAKIEPTEGRFG
jgi:riboflavin kinase/FMN adenylyltransferase